VIVQCQSAGVENMCVGMHARVLLDVYIFAGSVVIPECAINRCAVRCVGTQVLSPDHCIFHLCTHPSYDYQHMVSGTMNCVLLLLCSYNTDFFLPSVCSECIVNHLEQALECMPFLCMLQVVLCYDQHLWCVCCHLLCCVCVCS